MGNVGLYGSRLNMNLKQRPLPQWRSARGENICLNVPASAEKTRVAHCFVFIVAALLGVFGSSTTTVAAEPRVDHFAGLAEEYAEKARPLMKQYCLDCHSTAKQEGELDLERFATLAEVRRGTKVWLKVAEMLDNGEMPPKESKQPLPEQRKQLRGWVERYLNAEALANAGDPGPVVLRRLSNAEYTYTIRDLTGVDLNPAREFPADGAAGEGFTNTGNALVMSPALLTKYLDAGKEIARHAMLTPAGFRFSPSTTRSDWTNDTLAQIRALYREHTDSGGASQVNLQGIVFNTNDGGRLPIERYLEATLVDREALQSGTKSIAAVAKERRLNAKYLGILWTKLTGREPSLLLDAVRVRWRASKPDGAVPLAAEINRWQKALWRFTSVGHIGKVGGPKAWQEPVMPLTSRQEVRLKLPTTPDQKEVSLYLVASDAGDGNAHDFAVWQQPRLVAPGRPDLLLRDVRDFTREMTARRERLFASTAEALHAAAEIAQSSENVDVAALAKEHEVDLDSLTAWLDYLGIGRDGDAQARSLRQQADERVEIRLRQRLGLERDTAAGRQFVRPARAHSRQHEAARRLRASVADLVRGGWLEKSDRRRAADRRQSDARPSRMRQRRDVVARTATRHDSATARQRCRSRRSGRDHRPHRDARGPTGRPGVAADRPARRQSRVRPHGRGTRPQEAATRTKGDARGVEPDARRVRRRAGRQSARGSLRQRRRVALLYRAGEGPRSRTGRPEGVVAGSMAGGRARPEKQRLADAIQKLLTSGPPTGADEKRPDVVLYRQLTSLGGPFFMRAWPHVTAALHDTAGSAAERGSHIGLDPAMFGKHPDGSAIDAASLCVQAPSVIEVRLPADLVPAPSL